MTVSRRTAFLAQFHGDLLPHVVDYANTISDLDVDVCILTARKAACLFDAMGALGLVSLPGQITTDRVLDMDASWLSRKRVALIDDLLISGSTLYHDEKAIRQAGAADVKLYALAVDQKYWVPSLAQPNEPYLKLDDRRALNLSSQIIDAISVVPRPYNTDWPLYDETSLPRRAEHVLDSLGRWETFDTATTTQRRFGVLSLTHEASSSARRAFERGLGLDLNAARLLKVRIYGKPNPETASLDLRVLPIIAFEGLPSTAIDKVFNAIAEQARDEAREPLRYFDSAISRLRLIQFVMSARLGRMWLSDLLAVSKARIGTTLSTDQLALAFPPPAADAVRELAGGDDPIDVRARVIAKPRDLYAAPAGPFKRPDAWNLQARLVEPFHELHTELELPARELLRKHGRDAFEVPELSSRLGSWLNRLAIGHSIPELESLAKTAVGGENLNASLLISAFLDIAIDQGIAVPVMYQDDHENVMRAYRHGEDIEFGFNELRLFGIMLDAAVQGRGEGLCEAVAEKLCVLYLNIGLNAGRLNRWNGFLGDGDSVGIRYGTRGAAVGRNDEDLFGYHPNNGLISMLKDAGTLVVKDGKCQVGKIHQTAPTSEEAEAQAEIVGWIFGKLLRTGATPHLTHEDLTVLTSCAASHQTVAALATEIQSVKRVWPLARQNFEDIGSQPWTASQLRNSELFQAVTRGVQTYLKHRAQAADKIVKRVANSLSDPVYKQEWRQYFQSPIEVPSDIERLLAEQGEWLLAVKVNLEHAAWTVEAAGETPIVSSGRISDGSSRSRQIANAQGDSVAFFREAWSQLNDLIISQADDLMDRARATANPFGDPRQIISFKSAIFIRRCEGGDEFENLYEFVVPFINKHRKAAADSQRLIYSIQLAGAPDGYLVVGNGPASSKALQRLAIDIVENSQESMRIAVMPRLEDNEQVHTGVRSGLFQGTAFARRLRQVVEHPSMDNGPGAKICVMGPSSVASRAVRVITDELKSRAEVPRRVAPQLDTWSVKSIRVIGVSEVPVRKADVGIITVIPEETNAVVEWLEKGSNFDDPSDGSGRVFYSAEVAIEEQRLNVVATQCLNQGNKSAIVAYDEIYRREHPRLIVLLGVAGSIHKDVRFGDVVIAEDVIDYGPSAVTAAGVQRRGTTFRSESQIGHAVNEYFARRGGETVKLVGANGAPSNGREFGVRKGPIGSGEVTVKFRDSAIRAWLEGFNYKTLALETEAAGVAAYFHEHAKDGTQYIVLRGISDHADKAKNNRWKLSASRNAVIALEDILKILYRRLSMFEGQHP
ncbi:phosphorylase family protein [Streptomyces sp. DH10]|uniref:phosphorylase family protein n=1 Tax=Streptomyces sp. DH10 TaxID=3040121 RepID=UPI002441B69E|nr:hypothetical protein [Streptomyces sp. DH10]MDG9709616.1 hypothetical protein [Streptomyces sp. DH10]